MKRDIQKLKRAIEAQKAKIAKERDRLRDLIDDAGSILESCERADEHLSAAADALSEML